MNSYQNKIPFSILLIMIFGNLFGQNLDKHKWKNRVLILQASEKSSIKLQEQISEFMDEQDDLKERKLVIYQIVGKNHKILNGTAKNEEWKAVGPAYLVNKIPFKVTLIGLDGCIKLKQNKVLKKAELYNRIDSMPMRMSEERRRKN
jgi:hypothetical protein